MISSEVYPKYIEFLKTRPEFSEFSQEEMHILMNNMKVKQFKKGQVLFDQADDRNRFYFVAKGLVRAERVDETGDFIFYTYIKENLAFPYRGMFKDQYYPYTAQAMTNIEIVHFPMATFENLLLKNTDMMVKVIQEMATIISETEDNIQQMVNPSASQRVIQALKIFGKTLGNQSANGEISIPYPITIQELATVSGTTRETAGHILKKLVKENYISYEHKKFVFNKNF
ncbi:cyclic nucleotide-binding protein [Companilactobacillus sp. RD055328]|uniref:Crp/Fnr family transcriptional regulator n=1 Tax=Companilactobacillus sp. RD055328 TaxID=2916634 RepID=UPI001FC8C9C5|nr:Crp/Fnr family transcriptional regulator [Companilactobacillus sp. RD055328]GKQ42114.1 cyclic nucleotide-binding protein [Companilactobacillus sp. RD055328]